MTISEPHSPSGEKTRADFSGAATDPHADLHDETAAEFEEKFRDELNAFEEQPADDDHSEEAEAIRRRKQKARDDLNDKLSSDANGDEKDKAGFGKGEKVDFGVDGAHYTGSKFKDYMMYGIADKGAYFKYANGKQVSDKQLRRMIIRAHLDKGWTELRFYKKGGTIDGQLTSRAQAMIASEFGNSKLASLRSIAENVKVSSTPTKKVEPWRALNPYAYVDKAYDNTKRKLSGQFQQFSQDTRLGDKGFLAQFFPGIIGDADKPRAPTREH